MKKEVLIELIATWERAVAQPAQPVAANEAGWRSAGSHDGEKKALSRCAGDLKKLLELLGE